MEQRKYIKYGAAVLAGILIIEFFLFFFLTSVRNNEMENIKNFERDLGNLKGR